MGFHVSWIAARGKSVESVRLDLGLTATADREYVPESDVTGVLLPSGWYVVFFNDAMPPELAENVLETMSIDSEAMAFVIEEASMVSMVRGYANGRRIWEAIHDSHEGLEQLDISGSPPTTLATIRNRLLEESKTQGSGADYLFDVPAEVSKAVIGFRHDEDIEGIEGAAFTVLLRS